MNSLPSTLKRQLTKESILSRLFLNSCLMQKHIMCFSRWIYTTDCVIPLNRLCRFLYINWHFSNDFHHTYVTDTSGFIFTMICAPPFWGYTQSLVLFLYICYPWPSTKQLQKHLLPLHCGTFLFGQKASAGSPILVNLSLTLDVFKFPPSRARLSSVTAYQ